MAALAIATLGCTYAPDLGSCHVRCGSNGACPSAMTCGDDGYCQAPGETCGGHDGADAAIDAAADAPSMDGAKDAAADAAAGPLDAADAADAAPEDGDSDASADADADADAPGVDGAMDAASDATVVVLPDSAPSDASPCGGLVGWWVAGACAHPSNGIDMDDLLSGFAVDLDSDLLPDSLGGKFIDTDQPPALLDGAYRPQTQVGAPDLLVLPVHSFTVRPDVIVKVFGSRLLAIVATDNIKIDGTIEWQGFNSGCSGGAPMGTNAGGGGGGFGGQGGDGGSASAGAGGPGGTPAASGDRSLTPLRPGCNGGLPIAMLMKALCGMAGGALQLVAGNSIDVTGTVNVSGWGGCQVTMDLGGQGGGSGGSLLLEAPAISLGPGGLLLANGGGGAGGDCSADSSGGTGGRSTSATPASGGAGGCGAQGGAGGSTWEDGGVTPMACGDGLHGSSAGSSDGAMSLGGGGGGGGGGMIRIRRIGSDEGPVCPAP